MVHQQVVSADLIVNETDTDRRNYRVNFSKLRNHLGFQPQWTVEKGIQQVLEAIASGDVQDYRDAKYSNVKFLTESADAAAVRDNWARRLIESLPHE
jgi:dTDP-D-glucose 4,6-dehydratase